MQSGQFLGVFANTQHTHPFDFAFGPDGNVYVSSPQLNANSVSQGSFIDEYFGPSSPLIERTGCVQIHGSFKRPAGVGISNLEAMLIIHLVRHKWTVALRGFGASKTAAVYFATKP